MQSDSSLRDTADELRCCCLVHLSLPLCLCHLAPSYKYVMMFNAGVKKRFVCVWRRLYFAVLARKDRPSIIFFFMIAITTNASRWLLSNLAVKSLNVCKFETDYFSAKDNASNGPAPILHNNLPRSCYDTFPRSPTACLVHSESHPPFHRLKVTRKDCERDCHRPKCIRLHLAITAWQIT